MAAASRYYDGETAQAYEVAVRATGGELIIVNLADSAILARWPIADVAVLGDAVHEAAPPIVRLGGGEARLIVEDLDARSQLAALVPHLAALAAEPQPAGLRIAKFGATVAVLIGLFWGAIEYAPSMQHLGCPTACR